MAQGSGGGPGGPVPADQVCLSNRKANRPKTGHSLVRGVGIDKLSVSFPVSGWESDPSAWDSVSVRQPGTVAASERREARVPATAGWSVFVGVQEIPEHPSHRWWGKAEFNPSRVVDPDGWGLCSVEELPVAVKRAAMVIRERVAPVTDLGDWRVKRADVARDFAGVNGAPQLVRSLSALPRSWARRNFVHADAQRNGAQTLTVGSGAGQCRLYDLHAAHDAPDGALRVEMECRSRWLDRYGSISSLRDLTPSSVDVLMRGRWEWSAMGVEVAASTRALVERVRVANLTAAKEERFLGWLMVQAAGMARGGARQTAWRYRALQRELGIVASSDLLDVDAVVWRRLDLDEGTEVVRVA